MRRKTAKPVVILGGGGHAKVLIDALLLRKAKVEGFVDRVKKDLTVGGRRIPYLGNDDAVLKKYPAKKFFLVNGIGSIGDSSRRREIYCSFKEKGYRFAQVVHPRAFIAPGTELGEGVQIMAGVALNTGSRVGENTILNTSASVDHDCLIGAHVHIAPNAALSGNVTVGDRAHIGTNATVPQGRSIGEGAFVNAHTLVRDNVPPNTILHPYVGGLPIKVEG